MNLTSSYLPFSSALPESAACEPDQNDKEELANLKDDLMKLVKFTGPGRFKASIHRILQAETLEVATAMLEESFRPDHPIPSSERPLERLKVDAPFGGPLRHLAIPEYQRPFGDVRRGQLCFFARRGRNS